MSEAHLDRQLLEIVVRIRQIMRAERATLFLHDVEAGELWSRVLDGDELREIRIKVGEGIAGHVMATGETVRIDDAALDPRFAARFDRQSGFVTRSVLCLPLVHLDGRRIGVVQALNRQGGPFGERDEEVLAALCAQIAIAIENARLATDVEHARAAEAKLAAELEKKHRQLAAAYGSLEASHRELARTAHSAARMRWLAGAAAILLFVLLAVVVWLRSSPERMAEGAGGADEVTEVAIERRPLSVTVPLAGKLEPAAMTAVLSPVSGAVRRVLVRYGERVTAGQLLAELDTAQVEVEARSARATAIRAEQRARELANWDEGPDASSARRNLARADLELEAARRRLEETRQLHEKGIVRRGELEDAERAYANEELDHRSVEQALASVIARGGAENRRIAEMELENARVALARVEQRLAEAHVVAPLAGVAIAPEGGGRLTEGAQVEAGEPLVAIGELGELAVVCLVDEIEARRLRLGQRATVRGEAFGNEVVAATVRSVAAAAGDEAGDFEVALVLESVPPALATGFRLGLSVAAEILVFESEAALVVPVVAVTSDDEGDWVEVVGAGGAVERRRVELGEATIDLVEVRSGLAEGERVRVGGGS